MSSSSVKRAIRSTSLMALFATGLCCGLLPSGTAQAGWACNTATAAGIYGFEIDGDAGGSPLAAVGQIDLDGTGDASLVGYFTIAGTTESVQYYGSYNVNADCSASISLHTNDTDINIRAQFVRAGTQFFFLVEDQDTTAVGEAVRVYWR